MLQRVQCFLLLGVMASVSLHAQAPRRPPSVVGPSGSRVVSPAVVATSITKQRQNGDGELELLVLWRGSPGWFLEGGKDGRSGSVTWGGRASGRPGDSRETVDHQVFLGGLALHLQFNMQERTARVQDIEVSLQNANVILVDQVDSREDLTVVGTRWVDPQISGVPVRIEQILGRASELVDFLRCDASVPDPLVQGMVQMICDELLNR